MAFQKKSFSKKGEKNPKFAGVYVRFPDGEKENIGYSWWGGKLVGMKITAEGRLALAKAFKATDKDKPLNLYTFIADAESDMEPAPKAAPVKKTQDFNDDPF